jgi:DNA-binding response OmpR family regulator
VTLTRAGFATVEAASGEEALLRARELPDAILLDVKLPDILGFEVCQRLKRDATTSSIPIIQTGWKDSRAARTPRHPQHAPPRPRGRPGGRPPPRGRA